MPSSRRRFREDIQGLRGVAVLAVVADHLNIPGFGGGFTGVDIFFVISGFLLVGLMYKEVRHSGNVAVAAFYGRRARRILPAAMLVIFAVVLFANLTLNPIAIADIGQEAVWSTFFAMNLLLINRGADYFAGYDSVSPLQHYWSLGVEEQFYIALPVLFLLGLLLVSRSRGGLGRLVWLLAGISVASLVWCLWSSSHLSADTAYFSSLARAWQIGFGGLLAIAFAEGRINLIGRKAEVLGMAGVLVLVLTFVLVRGEGYPGWQALLPVAGALAVIASGTAVARDGFTQKLLSLRVLTLTGLISFSVYLWHWPVIIFTDRLWPSFEASPLRIPVLLAVTFALSVLSWAGVERPARRLSWYRFADRTGHAERLRRLALPMALVPAAAIVLFLGLGATGIVNRVGDVQLVRAGGFGSETEAQWAGSVRQALDLKQIPGGLVPPLADVPNDGEPMECLSIDQTNMDRCAWGGPHAKETVVVLGDSHAHMWFTALRYAFPPSRYRVQPLTKAKCLNAEIVRREPGLPASDPACERHRQWVMRQVRRLQPDIVVMSDFAGFNMWTEPDGSPTSVGVRAAWRDGLVGTLDEIAPLTSRIVLIGQTPEGKALADCLPRDLALTDCYGDDTAMAAQREVERELVEAVGGTFIDPGPWLCIDGRCPPVIDGTAVFHDDNHLTVSIERELAPLLAGELRAVSPD